MASIMFPTTLALATYSGQGLKEPFTTTITTTTTSGNKVKKHCRLILWLSATKTKLRAFNKKHNEPTTCSSEPSSEKARQHRRIHNEVFGWTSEDYDNMTASSTSSLDWSCSTFPTWPIADLRSREEILIASRQATIRRIEDDHLRRVGGKRYFGSDGNGAY